MNPGAGVGLLGGPFAADPPLMASYSMVCAERALYTHKVCGASCPSQLRGGQSSRPRSWREGGTPSSEAAHLKAAPSLIVPKELDVADVQVLGSHPMQKLERWQRPPGACTV